MSSKYDIYQGNSRKIVSEITRKNILQRVEARTLLSETWKPQEEIRRDKEINTVSVGQSPLSTKTRPGLWQSRKALAIKGFILGCLCAEILT